MTDPYRPKGLSSAVCYQDAKAAFRWLEAAFGFEPLFVILGPDGTLAHSEMTFGNSVVMVGNEWSADHKSPKSIGGENTQTVHVQLAQDEDVDAHCERARKAGAEILQEPPDTVLRRPHLSRPRPGRPYLDLRRHREKDDAGRVGQGERPHHEEAA